MGRFGDALLTPFGWVYAALSGIGYGAPFALVFGLPEVWTARGALLVGLGLSLLHGAIRFRRIRERGRVMHATAARILARRRARDHRNAAADETSTGPEDPVH